ncbi:MAG: hypothetical protein KIS91_02000 [Anaerolineae bacterium]|nr:hypothetical protein [Anaerolineae bacterium]
MTHAAQAERHLEQPSAHDTSQPRLDVARSATFALDMHWKSVTSMDQVIGMLSLARESLPTECKAVSEALQAAAALLYLTHRELNELRRQLIVRMHEVNSAAQWRLDDYMGA